MCYVPPWNDSDAIFFCGMFSPETTVEDLKTEH